MVRVTSIKSQDALSHRSCRKKLINKLNLPYNGLYKLNLPNNRCIKISFNHIFLV